MKQSPDPPPGTNTKSAVSRLAPLNAYHRHMFDPVAWTLGILTIVLTVAIVAVAIYYSGK